MNIPMPKYMLEIYAQNMRIRKTIQDYIAARKSKSENETQVQN